MSDKWGTSLELLKNGWWVRPIGRTRHVFSPDGIQQVCVIVMFTPLRSPTEFYISSSGASADFSEMIGPFKTFDAAEVCFLIQDGNLELRNRGLQIIQDQKDGSI